GANDVYVVRGRKGEILVPALKSVVREIDLERGRMTVDLPPGLAE
ncbi:MAG: 16S rRNA processing protein RimM, partial [Firmicutes bacterium]|nr:16S rRNA processing protein RimM [Bacillota bacterium]